MCYTWGSSPAPHTPPHTHTTPVYPSSQHTGIQCTTHRHGVQITAPYSNTPPTYTTTPLYPTPTHHSPHNPYIQESSVLHTDMGFKSLPHTLTHTPTHTITPVPTPYSNTPPLYPTPTHHSPHNPTTTTHRNPAYYTQTWVSSPYPKCW